jgi:pyruvate/2-oxoglutarate dehydrogenase complex dihydrolipoamide acyltransferase (E2) component
VLKPVPRTRRAVLDVLHAASRRVVVHGLVEFDVGAVAQRLAESDPPVSWTGFVIASVGRAVVRHPEVNVRMAGNRLLSFHRVDVAATVEREFEDGPAPVAVAVRDSDRASPEAVTDILRTARRSPRSGLARTRILARLPGPLRRTATRLAGSRPRVAAGFGPPVGVTSLGMFGPQGGWAIPVVPLTLVVTVGHVVDRAVVRDGRVVVRPMLPLTLSFDHAVVDGAPAARFAETLRRLIETGGAFLPSSQGDDDEREESTRLPQ